MYYGHMGTSNVWLMIMLWAFFIGLIIWLISQNTKNKKESATDILNKRYAKGELTKNQYEEIKSEISQS